METEIDNVIQLYYGLGFKHQEILNFLAHHHALILSHSTLKRKLRKLKLFRRKNYSDLLDICLYVLNELESSGRLHGYRWLHLKCTQAGFSVSRDTIYDVMKILDPEGVEQRRRRRLTRRRYVSSGPNHVWHVDSYDKLKRYGIAINGSMDGFSRKIIWLHANTTNSDPKVIANYYISAVKSKRGCPQRVRADMGTENTIMEQMQTFLRRNHQDDLSGTKSFLYGKSVHNQRIEWFWGILSKETAQFYMDMFAEMSENGIDLFCGDFLDVGLIQFCFMRIIQDDLDSLQDIWDTHVLQSKPGGIGSGKRPLTLYNLPHLYGAEDKLCNVNEDEILACEEETTPTPRVPCHETVRELCEIIMEENRLQMPSSALEAKRLYVQLRANIRLDL